MIVVWRSDLPTLRGGHASHARRVPAGGESIGGWLAATSSTAVAGEFAVRSPLPESVGSTIVPAPDAGGSNVAWMLAAGWPAPGSVCALTLLAADTTTAATRATAGRDMSYSKLRSPQPPCLCRFGMRVRHEDSCSRIALRDARET